MGRLISFELSALKILFLVLDFVEFFSANVPEGLISLLENFSLKADKKAVAAAREFTDFCGQSYG